MAGLYYLWRMLTVGIKNFEIWTFAGLYPEEKQVPNKLIFNISVALDRTQQAFLDYTLLIDMIKNACKRPIDLLEDLLHILLAEIRQLAPGGKAHISIEKCHPPTGDQIQASFVTWND